MTRALAHAANGNDSIIESTLLSVKTVHAGRRRRQALAPRGSEELRLVGHSWNWVLLQSINAGPDLRKVVLTVLLPSPLGGCRDKNVIVPWSERVNLDQNASEPVPGKRLKNEVE